jgi:hypothetical protein
VTPTDASVTTAKLADTSVTSAKLSGNIDAPGTLSTTLSNSTQTTPGLTINNTVSGGYGAALAFDVFRSDSSSQATAARIYPSRADVWNSDAASDADLNFQVSQDGTVATRMTVSGTGDVSVTDGNLLFSGSGHGVYLGVTSATASNLLDDYEEGDFQVTTTYAGSGSWGLNTSNDTLHYVKVGTLVHIMGQIKVNAYSSASGIGYIDLPFAQGAQTEDADTGTGEVQVLGAGANSNVFCINVYSGLARLYFDRHDTTSLANAALAQFDSNMAINISISYHTA